MSAKNSRCLKDCLINGVCWENPVFRLVLGLCPTLAVTVSVINGLGMGIAATLVLLCSNTIIAMFKHLIPAQIRIPCYIVIIASFVTATKLLLQAYLPAIYAQLGLFMDIMVVNCIILGRAEAFASQNKVVDSIFDALGMGVGFTLATTMIGAIREVMGKGMLLGHPLNLIHLDPIVIMILPPGAFLTIGLLIAIINKLSRKAAI